jgi:membrane-bound ClpP family serine protease
LLLVIPCEAVVIRHLIWLFSAISAMLWAPAVWAQDLLVYKVGISRAVRSGTAQIVRRAVSEAELSGAAAVILEIDVTGGSMNVARQIAYEVALSRGSVYALVDRRAWDAGALIALAADSVFMRSGASLGADSYRSNQSDETVTAVDSLREEFGRMAEQRGIDPRIAQAMADGELAIPGVVERGATLALTPDQAVELGVAAAVVDGLDDMLERLNLAAATVRTVGEGWITTTVQIQNNNWGDLRVYILKSGGSRFRLGTVTSMNSATYTVPQQILTPGDNIRIIAEVIGSDASISSEVIFVQPGLVVEWMIENVLRNSTIFIWIRS